MAEAIVTANWRKNWPAIPGMKAVVLGGSFARGRARPESDIDLYLFYSESSPFSIQGLRELAEAVNDSPAPGVTDFYGWGRWVNGGAWLTIGGFGGAMLVLLAYFLRHAA